MVGFKHTVCALLLTIFTGVAVAQNNTNSPYTRYGYGELADQNFGNSKAMGGIAYGLRDGSQINPLNPASYTAIDSLTFLFEGGVTLQNANLNSGALKMNLKNSSFDYIAMQFRMRPWMAMSIGLLPYSNVGYNLSQTVTEGDLSTVKSLSGEGGLHKLYVGLGVKVMKNLSLGVNASYFWGGIERNTHLYILNFTGANSYRDITSTTIRDYSLDFGLQYTQPIGQKHSVTLGAVFTPERSLSNTTYVISGVLTPTGDSFASSSTVDSITSFGLPSNIGLGLTYNYDKRLTVGADYSLQKWSKVAYMNQPNMFADRAKISVGAEYIPSRVGRSYLSHVKYRLGGYYTTPYYKIEGSDERASREYGLTAGLGLPVPKTRSILSLSAQYVRVEGLVPTAINENIFRVSIGLTFNERWFHKRKVD